MPSITAKAEAKPAAKAARTDLILSLISEIIDRSRKDIQRWRRAMAAAENTDDPRWVALQDLYSDLNDGHLGAMLEIRRAASLNNRFYVTDLDGNQLDEQSRLLNSKWFFDFVEAALDSIFYKHTLIQLLPQPDGTLQTSIIPRRNVCPQLGRMYLEAFGGKYIAYDGLPGVIPVVHHSPFGIINDIVPNLLWKRNALQSLADFSEKYGQPLITAETSNQADAARIQQKLEELGEAARATFPTGTSIQIHDLANAGRPDLTYLDPARFHDEQVSKRILGSATIADSAANRSQTEVHERTLDDKLATADKRMLTFLINDVLLGHLAMLGLPFNPATMRFQFDETESLSLTQQWSIVKEAAQLYELDQDWVAQTFNLPIIKERERNMGLFARGEGFSANFQ